MPARRKSPINLLSRLKGTVQYSSGGLTWVIEDVQADEFARVSAAVLEAARDIRSRFPELLEQTGDYHGGGYETADEEGTEDYNETPTLAHPRRAGFVAP
jgi:hypothetical protein